MASAYDEWYTGHQRTVVVVYLGKTGPFRDQIATPRRHTICISDELQIFRHPLKETQSQVLVVRLEASSPGCQLATMALLEAIIKPSLSMAVRAVLRRLTPIARLLHVLVSEMRK